MSTLVIFRCGLCGAGIHPGDETHLYNEGLDEIACSSCVDDHHDIMLALYFWLEHNTTRAT